MSKPAARIGDMHLCPMVTPGVPPIPHVGGPVMGPGVPTVLIGGMPAAVMGDMCTCVGPPDSIILGSTGVLIGGKPAARMGDTTVHGGSIILGCPTVLIGEISPGTIMTKTSLTILEQFKPESEQVISMQQAAEAGKPFCEVCTPRQGSNPEDSPTEEEKEKELEIIDIYWMDMENNQIDEFYYEEKIQLYVKVKNVDQGDTVTITVDEKQDSEVVATHTLSGTAQADGIVKLEPITIKKSEEA